MGKYDHLLKNFGPEGSGYAMYIVANELAELIRVIGRKINEKGLDDNNSSYYKKVSLEMRIS